MAEQLFELAGFELENDIGARQMLLFDAGDDAEYRLIRRLEDIGYQIIRRGPDNRQIEVEGTKPDRAGHLDGFILFEDKWYPFDVKTAATFSFSKWLSAAGKSFNKKAKDVGLVVYDPRDVPNPDYSPVEAYSSSYFYQAQGYMQKIFEDKEKLADITRFGDFPIGEGFYFFVQHKDTSTLYQEYVPYRPEKIEARLLTLERGYGIIKTPKGKARKPTQSLAKRIRKEREYELGKDWQCGWCPAKKVCWDEE